MHSGPGPSLIHLDLQRHTLVVHQRLASQNLQYILDIGTLARGTQEYERNVDHERAPAAHAAAYLPGSTQLWWKHQSHADSLRPELRWHSSSRGDSSVCRLDKAF